MFCYKCGEKLPDDSDFCYMCGEKTVKSIQSESDTIAVNSQSIPAPSTNTAAQQVYAPAQSFAAPQTEQLQWAHKSGSRKKPFKIIAIIVIIVAVVAIALTLFAKYGGDSYTNSLKAYTPFYEYSCSCGDVFGRYLTSAKWTSFYEDENKRLVEVSGDIKNVGKHFVLHVYVTDNGDDTCTFSFHSLYYNGEGTTNRDNIVNFLYRMFDAYDSGYKDLSELLK